MEIFNIMITGADRHCMSGEPKDLRDAKANSRVMLDGRVVRIPQQFGGSATAIRDYLESMAMHQERVLSSLTVDGTSVKLRSKRIEIESFSEIHAESTTFYEMGRQLISKANKQVGDLIQFVESISMQMVINDWQKVESAWKGWIAEFKSPLIAVKLLKDLCGNRIDELMIGEIDFGTHNRKFAPIIRQLEAIYRKKDSVLLSDFLERSFIPWLQGFAAYLAILDRD